MKSEDRFQGKHGRSSKPSGRDTKRKMVGERKKSRQNKSARLGTPRLRTFSCQLLSCRKPFTARVQGKKQLFCSIPCRVKFFEEARAIGAALLKRALTDPEAEAYLKGLLEEKESEDDSDDDRVREFLWLKRSYFK